MLVPEKRISHTGLQSVTVPNIVDSIPPELIINQPSTNQQQTIMYQLHAHVLIVKTLIYICIYICIYIYDYIYMII